MCVMRIFTSLISFRGENRIRKFFTWTISFRSLIAARWGWFWRNWGWEDCFTSTLSDLQEFPCNCEIETSSVMMKSCILSQTATRNILEIIINVASDNSLLSLFKPWLSLHKPYVLQHFRISPISFLVLIYSDKNWYSEISHIGPEKFEGFCSFESSKWTRASHDFHYPTMMKWYRWRIHQNQSNSIFFWSIKFRKRRTDWHQKLLSVEFSWCVNKISNIKYWYQTVFEVSWSQELSCDDRTGE